MNEQIGRPVLRAYRRGHPAPKGVLVGFGALWGFIAWSGVQQYSHGDNWGILWGLVGAVYFALNGFTLATWKLRCRLYHAAEVVVITAMQAYKLTDEQEKEIMEARRD